MKEMYYTLGNAVEFDNYEDVLQHKSAWWMLFGFVAVYLLFHGIMGCVFKSAKTTEKQQTSVQAIDPVPPTEDQIEEINGHYVCYWVTKFFFSATCISFGLWYIAFVYSNTIL